MAKLLYDKEPREEIIPSLTRNGVTISEEEMCQLDDDFVSLENYTESYISVSTVYEHLVDKPINFLDSGNFVLYNEYIKNITKNLDTKSPVLFISQEAIDHMPSVVLNRKLALEGFVADMWAKIKELFKRIYEAVKKFFADIFTRMGRMKKKLKNLEKVLGSTNKDIKTIHLDKIPGGLASSYPVSGSVNYNAVMEVFANTTLGTTALVKINAEAKKLAGEDILDSSFVADIKALKSKSAALKQETGNQPTDTTKPSEGGSLTDASKSIDAPVNKAESDAIEIGSKVENEGITNSDSDTEGENKALASFKLFSKNVADTLEPLKGKKLIKGKIISEIEVDAESSLKFVITTEKDKPDGINLGDKTELIKLISASNKIFEGMESVAKTFSEVNDSIFKNLDAVDKITKDIDAIQIESLGKYRAVLQKKIKTRLNLMKNFFKGYNEVNKNMFSMTIDAIDGNINYTVLSLKYFG
ncbi:hypothetical protein AGENTSMITH_34 [Bacillus phage vB_BspM_AgentSmith]|nr:hypothetical protein AGENTSMITH_34 [Bacillus phage vB_BspM_AgentSmith]